MLASLCLLEIRRRLLRQGLSTLDNPSLFGADVPTKNFLMRSRVDPSDGDTHIRRDETQGNWRQSLHARGGRYPSHTFNTRLASVETSCPSKPNLRSTASATQFFPAIATHDPPLSSIGLEDASAHREKHMAIAATTKYLTTRDRIQRAAACKK